MDVEKWRMCADVIPVRAKEMRLLLRIGIDKAKGTLTRILLSLTALANFIFQSRADLKKRCCAGHFQTGLIGQSRLFWPALSPSVLSTPEIITLQT